MAKAPIGLPPWTVRQHNTGLKAKYKPVYIDDKNENVVLFVGHDNFAFELANIIVKAVNKMGESK